MSARTSPRRKEKIRVLISERRLRNRIKMLGAEVSRAYRGQEIVLVGVLKGCVLFVSDLSRALDLDVKFDFLRVSSYGDGTESTGSVRIEFDVTQPIRGKHILLVEDIIDTGQTAQSVLKMLRARGPASVRLCSLLHKPARAKVRIPIDYLGFTIPNEFVVGYGLDHAGRYRNLPYIGILET